MGKESVTSAWKKCLELLQCLRELFNREKHLWSIVPNWWADRQAFPCEATSCRIESDYSSFSSGCVSRLVGPYFRKFLSCLRIKRNKSPQFPSQKLFLIFPHNWSVSSLHPYVYFVIFLLSGPRAWLNYSFPPCLVTNYAQYNPLEWALCCYLLCFSSC